MILVFAGYYLPGFKGGGPIKTIANMVGRLCGDFQFMIVTRDHDLGEPNRYSDIEHGQWNQVGQAQVFYLPPSGNSLQVIRSLVDEVRPDLLYLNSFFDPWFTLKPVLASQWGELKSIPILLAPRGEFSAEAMKLKDWKKVPYSILARWLGLLDRVNWHASTELEGQDIVRVMRVDRTKINLVRQISVAPDLIRMPEDVPKFVVQPYGSDRGVGLRVCFLSRIAEMKNLDFALQALRQVKATVRFSIYGPLESQDYWASCSRLMRELPQNIHAEYCGSVPSHRVRETIAQHELFFVPSRGENFGHVFVEALSVGVPILVSDQTPWRGLAVRKLGWDFSLKSTAHFAEAIDQFAGLPNAEKAKISLSCLQFSRQLAEDEYNVDLNREMFWRTMKPAVGNRKA